MIHHLLWRCPLCAANDALRHTERWLLPDRVDCRACRASWRVRRAVGDNFYLKLVSAHPPLERSLSAWYDQMKASLRLEALTEESPGLCAPGESLYLASQAAELWGQAEENEATPDEADFGTRLDRGRLFLTGERLLWRGAAQELSLPLARLSSADTILTLGLAATLGLNLYFFHFLDESPLKWVAYLGLLAPRIQAQTGRKLHISHY